MYTYGEHCLLLTGYDKDYYYFNDPWTNARSSYGEEITRTFSDEFIIREGSFFYLLVYSIKAKMPLEV